MINNTPELPSKGKTPFDLPKMTCRDLPFERCTNELVIGK